MAKIKSKPAVFLDRDGVLIYDHGYVHKPEDIELFPDVGEGLLQLQEAGFWLLVVTNQSGVARGLFGLQAVYACHQEIQRQLRPYGVQLDAFYSCPHHPAGSVSPFNITCRCRKPASGLLEQAVRERPIDLTHSYIIGDKQSDIECGMSFPMPLKGVQMQRQYPLHSDPWRVADSFKSAVAHIIDDCHPK